MMKGFKEFIMAGNLVQTAVAFVMGLAFSALVSAFIRDLITPLIAAAGGQPNFAALKVTLNHSTFMYGDFVNALITFLIIAAVLYYFVVVPYTKLMSLRETESGTLTTRECPFCGSTIPIKATRCAFCTSELGGTAAAPAK
jgi:large conductance mechanosensitive channel